jgi:EAL domain-containing protein (putative c-di-GMP-specific phosphodiesterase class I)
VRKKVSTLRYLQGDMSLQVTMNVGISAVTKLDGDAGDTLTTARMACEAAKDGGRDRIRIFDSDNRSVIRRYDDMQLVTEIQKALDCDGLELLAQPIAPLRQATRGPHYEVLLRMPDGEGGRVPSDALFSAAERYRIMPQIDRWVTSTTISRLAECADDLLELGASFAVNLSGQSLGDKEILEFIENELDASKLPASLLCFEITESAAVSNFNTAQSFIDRLRERGCKISLDDFGAGLSSFAYLKNFNVDILKIDGSFVRDVAENRISEAMVAAITQVAKIMGLETVAEFVETKAAHQLLRKLKVDFAQGHYVGKPVALDDAISTLLQRQELSTA